MLNIILPVVISLIVVYFLFRKLGMRRIEYRRYFSEEGIFEGDTVLLIEEISNRSFVPLIMVDVDTFLSNELRLVGDQTKEHGMQQFISRFYLPPFMRIKRSIEVICKKRGYYQLESVNINGASVDAKAILYVYPQALPCGKSTPMENEMQNMVQTSRRLFQDPFSFAGIRDYRPGDAFRSINYKATAKTGVLKVNDQDFFSSRNIMIYIDFGQHYPHPLTTEVYTALMERALSYSADMVWNSIQQGFSVGFAANSRALSATHVRFPMGRGHSHYMEILKEMAVIRMADGCSFLWLTKQDLDSLWNVDIYIMTTNNLQTLGDIVDIYNSRGNNVTIIRLEEENGIENMA